MKDQGSRYRGKRIGGFSSVHVGIMTTPCYSVTQQPIETLLHWIKLGEIAIPEIQRPFVWDATRVRKFLDSLFQGYPVGYLIDWRNPDVRLKDGTSSSGKRILIDGQQRIVALMASLQGQEIIDKDYQKRRIRIAFHPTEEQFEVYDAAIAKDVSWIPDIAVVFDSKTGIFDLVNSYCERNPGANKDDIYRSIENLRRITSNQIGLIELNPDLDIDTVNEIFIRVNSQGVPLGQADFAMSKIAVNEKYDGNLLRKAIDYFCHLAVAPDFYNIIKNDSEFDKSDFLQHMAWLRNESNDLYCPSYTDMLRVAFTSEFGRGRLGDLVALLSGRNFETKQFEEAIVETSFNRLRNGINSFMNETHFKRFIMIIRSAGFVDSSMIGSQNTLNFAYILYLALRSQGTDNAEIERHVRRWFVMSMLTGRYSGSAESEIDKDVRQIRSQGVQSYSDSLIRGELSEAFWNVALPQELDTSSANSPSFNVFQAAQVKMNDRGFLSSDLTARELIEIKCDLHHIFPKDFLKKNGLSRGQYNQVANLVIAQSEINIAIGSREPTTYFTELLDQCRGGSKRYGNIIDLDKLQENLRMNCIPEALEQMSINDYSDFLAKRRGLMAQKIKAYFESL